MSSNDLASLFGAKPQGMAVNSLIVQGLLTSFSKTNGTNTVTVNGATLTNVPMLATGAEVDLAEGDAVCLIVLGNTYMILGRVAMPSSSAFASASVATASANATTSGFSIPSSAATQLSASISVPVWANHAAVVLTCTLADIILSPATQIIAYLQATIDGQSSGYRGCGNSAANVYGTVTVSKSISETVTPGGTVSLSAQISTQGVGTIANNSSFPNTLDLTAIAVFTKQ